MQLIVINWNSMNFYPLGINYPENMDDRFINPANEHQVLRSESGLFECDPEGKLIRFFPDPRNLLDEVVLRGEYAYGTKAYYRPCVHTLFIPDGVTAFTREFFRYGYVENEISFPDSLVSLGSESDDCVFANTRLPKVTIPESVETIGTFAFGGSTIDSVRFMRLFKSIFLRQFKEAGIGTVYLPEEFRQQWEQRSMHDYPYFRDMCPDYDVVFLKK